MDEFSGYFTVFPCNFKDPNAPKNEPYLYIRENCPKDIKDKILAKWEIVYKETKERHKQGLYSSKDYF